MATGSTKEMAHGDLLDLVPDEAKPFLVSGFTLFNPTTDPQVIYDEVQGRFFYTFVFAPAVKEQDIANGIDCFALAAGTPGDCSFALAIGFSKNSAPQSKDDFCKYFRPYGDTLPDYPKLGDTKDFLLIGTNLNSHGNNPLGDGADVLWVSKPAAGAISGGCPSPSSFKSDRSGVLHNVDGSLAWTPVPAHSIDQTDIGWVAATRQLKSRITCKSVVRGCPPTSNYLSLFKVTTALDGSASFRPAQQVPLPCGYAYSAPPLAPQPGAAPPLDTLDGRLTQAVLAQDPSHGSRVALWTQHTVATYDGRSMVQWYEVGVDPTGSELFQYGQVSDPNLFVYNGAISPDRSRGRFGDNFAIGVNTSSASANLEIQQVTNLQSTLTMVKKSTAPLAGTSRWGDYSAASPDPVNAFDAVLGVSGVTLTNAFTQGDHWETWNWQVPFTTPILAPSASAVSITGFTHVGDLTYETNVPGRLVYDSATQQMLFITLPAAPTREPGPARVWDLKQDPSKWQPIRTQHAGPPSAYELVFYNPRTCRVEVLSVYNMQVSLAFTGTDWQSLPQTSAPPRRFNTGLMYDPKNNNMLMFGGIKDQSGTPLGDTWTWDGKIWTEQHPDPAHRPPATSIWASDPAGAGVLLYDNVHRETWLWNGTDWNQLNPLHSPPAFVRLLTISPTGSASGHLLALSQTIWLWDGNDWVDTGTAFQIPQNGSSGSFVMGQLAYDQDTQTLWLAQTVQSSDGLTLTSRFWTAKVNFTPRR
jgi:hypothetical protein